MRRRSHMKVYADFIVTNTSGVLTLDGPDHPRRGQEMSELGYIPEGALAARNGKIVWTGPESARQQSVDVDEHTRIVDAGGCAVIPGFVEAHSHLVFAGTRETEFSRKIAGVPYMQIAAEGGGIRRTVRDTRAASESDLYDLGLKRLREALRFGITTLEIKSGYGLDFDTEMKILKVARRLGETTPVDIVPTFLGAHEVPAGREKSDYLDEVCHTMIPYVAKNRLAEFCDVFCEKGVYSIEESERVLLEGRKHGLLPKIHADQMTSGGGAELAARLGAISADHLDYTGPAGLETLSRQGVVGVVLPGAVFFLGLHRYPPIREMVAAGVPVALSTDFNPGSCMSLNIHLMMTIACVTCRMTIPEAYTATTINGAWAVNRQNVAGSLTPGKKADIVILDCPSPDMVPYHFGHNHVRHVFCHGKQVVEDGVVLPF